MSIFKCKMCGGTLEISADQTTAVCEYCGTEQTLPKLSDDRRANLYDRANHFRRNNEFDKAMDIYENILNEDSTDAEAYWSLVLCRYGIEYVEDPASRKRVPTVNRAQFTSIFDDDNYKSALAYADPYQRAIYEQEARAINEIQKGILAISQKEKPFDVFICYKETDNNGRRTMDSVLANDLYHQLTNEGFKVFFSRITLEDKLGVAYEPYIFAALNSAKVMVVLGTRPEYFTAVWVKNEWSRYLALVKQSGGKKVLIPAYRDMDPYDLPEEFSHLQAQDMSKLGFMQDLIRGIKKLTQTEAPVPARVQETVAVSAAAANVAPLLRRAFMFLEDGDFVRADEFCEQVLNLEPENAEAYLGKLMVEMKCRKQEELKHQKQPFDTSTNYAKVIRFGSSALMAEMQSCIAYINERGEQEGLESIYQDALIKMNAAKTEQEYRAAAEIYQKIPGYKDADSRAEECRKRMTQLEEEEERRQLARAQRAKRNKKITAIVATSAAIIIVIFLLVPNVFIPLGKYHRAMDLMESGQFEEAYDAFAALGEYQDSQERMLQCQWHICGVGDTVLFGSYHPDAGEYTEWLVLEVKDGKALLVSKDILDCKPYNESYTSITWANCTLRDWLNGDFMDAAFTAEEQSRILLTNVSNPDNPRYGTDGGSDTQDYVFLLSIEEASRYFSSNAARQAAGTAYAKDNGLYVADNGNSFWWLRSPGRSTKNAANVNRDGGVYGGGSNVSLSNYGVRPALWVDLES